MKRLICLIFAVILALGISGCGKSSENQIDSPNIPPAFSVIQNQLKLTKHGKKGEDCSFVKDDFVKVTGENLTYITVKTLPEESQGVLVFNGKAVAKDQNLPSETLEYLKFVPSSDCASAAFSFTCDSESFGGKELQCEIIYTDTVNSPPVAESCSVMTVEGISYEGELKINEPDGDAFTVKVIGYPTNGFISVDKDGKIVYVPEDGFSGSDTMVYSVMDKYGAESERATLDIKVEKNESGIEFADMQRDMSNLYAHRMCSNNVMVYRISDGKYYFDPASAVTKMEFLVMAMCVSGEDAGIVAVADSAVNDDNGLSSGLKGYLSAANDKGLILLENGGFSPNEKITVADASYIIASILKLPKAGMADSSADASAVYASMIAAADAGFFETLSPDAVITKQEAAKLLCRMEDYMKENNMMPDVD